MPVEAAAPMAAWLCHDSCKDNGAIYQAFAGRFSRTVIGELAGEWDFAATPESVATLAPRLRRHAPLRTASNSSEMAARILGEAKERRSRSG
jgi:hypothetical protein